MRQIESERQRKEVKAKVNTKEYARERKKEPTYLGTSGISSVLILVRLTRESSKRKREEESNNERVRDREKKRK